MTDTDFKTEYLLKPMTPLNQEHVRLWLVYFVKAEEFDRHHSYDSVAIIRHIKELMASLNLEWTSYKEERDYVRRLRPDTRVRELARLEELEK